MATLNALGMIETKGLVAANYEIGRASCRERV